MRKKTVPHLQKEDFAWMRSRFMCTQARWPFFQVSPPRPKIARQLTNSCEFDGEECIYFRSFFTKISQVIFQVLLLSVIPGSPKISEKTKGYFTNYMMRL